MAKPKFLSYYNYLILGYYDLKVALIPSVDRPTTVAVFCQGVKNVIYVYVVLEPDQISQTQSMVAKRGCTNIHTPM